MKVGDVMTRPVRTCRPNDSLNEVMRIMWEQDLGALPVTNEEHQPIAMITDRDIAVAAYTQGKSLGQLQVQGAMSRCLHTVHVSDTLSTAEQIMALHRVRRVPVVDESTRIAGILSIADVARLNGQWHQAPLGDHGVHQLARTLAAIVQPGAAQNLPPPNASERGPWRSRDAFRDPQDWPRLASPLRPRHRLSVPHLG